MYAEEMNLVHPFLGQKGMPPRIPGPHHAQFRPRSHAAQPNLYVSRRASRQPQIQINAQTGTEHVPDRGTFELARRENAPRVGTGHADGNKPPPTKRMGMGRVPQDLATQSSLIFRRDSNAPKAAHLLLKAAKSQNAAATKDSRPSPVEGRRDLRMGRCS